MTIEHDDCIKRGKIKPFSRGITLAPKELETAKADLETARKTYKEEDYKSTLIQLPHTPGQRWINVEVVRHVIGTCQMYNSALLDKMGFLYQPSLYGYDDVIASHKSQIAGFYNCFLNHIDIDHIDEGKTPYQSWKEKHSSEVTQEVIRFVNEMLTNQREIYQPYY